MCICHWVSRRWSHAHILLWISAVQNTSLTYSAEDMGYMQWSHHRWSISALLKDVWITRCANQFPKANGPETVMNKYPKMLNHKMGSPTQSSNIMPRVNKPTSHHNQHVIPYNPHLSMLLGWWVNVEFYPNLLGSIKYIHKYIHLQGSNHATIIISPDSAADEICHYQDCCYLVLLKQCVHGCTCFSKTKSHQHLA